jgi:hypothetical protein
MQYDGWTADERRKHEQGRALMQSARDSRKNRIEYEAKRKEREAAAQKAAQKAADERAALEEARRVNAFMGDFVTLLAKHGLKFMPMQSTWGIGDTQVFKLVDRTAYKSPEWTVSVRPGVGFNWRK